MEYDPEFQKMLTKGYCLVSVNVLYYLPDCPSLLGEFFWQTLDLTPRYPRIHQFLNYWHKEIDAVIKEVAVSNGQNLQKGSWRNGIIIPID